MLHRIEFDDFAKAHHFRFAERLVGQEFVQFIARFRASDQDSSGGWNRRAGHQEAAIIIALLQELAMRGYELGSALFERNKVLSLQKEVLHPAFSVYAAH
jgi:hypothetical protein